MIGNPLPTWGKTLPPLGKVRGLHLTKPRSSRSRAVKFRPGAISYQAIKEQVWQAIERLPTHKRNLIPLAGTLPEIMVGLALVLLGYMFAAQSASGGGRLRLGGAVVDFKVWLGSRVVVVRIQGDYWHSLPARKLKDAVQYDRLHRQGYRVADIWEGDIYRAWVDGSFVTFVNESILGAG